MRPFAVLAVVTAGILVGSPAGAQIVDDCHSASPTVHVVLKPVTGPSIRGTLLCISAVEVLLARDGRIVRTPLDSVRRIHTPSDRVWDGAVAGAAIPLIFAAILCDGYCDARSVFKIAGTYGLIGLTVDALHSHQKTIYDRSVPRPSIAWRVRF